MSVNTQVSGNKQLNIQPSKNLGTVINTEVSGNYKKGVYAYKKITDVQPTQVSGEVHNTNYMGVNDEGMDIRGTKKITGDELNVQTYPTAEDARADFIADANELIAQQEAEAKKHPVEPGPGPGPTPEPEIEYMYVSEIGKSSFLIGETFTSEGVKLTVHYVNNTEVTLTSGFTVEGPDDMSYAHMGNAQVTYRGVSTSYNVAIVESEDSLVWAYVQSLPTKAIYALGEELDLTGMEIYGIKYNGNEVLLTSGQYSTDPVEGSQLMTPGESQTINIIVPIVDGTYNQTSSFFVNVSEYPVLKSIAVTTPPTKTTYEYGDYFDATGMVVTATNSDNTTANITDGCTLSPAVTEPLQISDTKITISFNEFSTSQAITVTPKATPTPEGLEITTQPTKTTYTEGEYFDPTGMVVTLVLFDGAEYTRETTTDYVLDPDTTTPLTTDVTSISVTYPGLIVGQAVSITVNPQ